MRSKRRKVFTPQSVIRWLRAKLRQDPWFISTLRQIIDEIPGEISDDDLFELVKPSLSRSWPPSDDVPSISPESVDLLFYSWVRKKLKRWQADYFNEALEELDRDKAKYKIEKVFKNLTFRGSGLRPLLSDKQQDVVFALRNDIKTVCKNIIQDASIADTREKGLESYKEERLREQFDWCRTLPSGNPMLKKAASSKRAEQMRANVLAIKYNCDPRNIKEIIRRKGEGFRELRKLTKKDPHIRSATIYGSGKKKRIRTP